MFIETEKYFKYEKPFWCKFTKPLILWEKAIGATHASLMRCKTRLIPRELSEKCRKPQEQVTAANFICFLKMKTVFFSSVGKFPPQNCAR